MNPDDILMWPDGFWCFREEFSSAFLRDYNYRLIRQNSEEWSSIEHESEAKG